MTKIILFAISLFLIFNNSFGQSSNEKIMFIVDSIEVAHDPEEGNELLQTNVADMTIIKNKDSLKFFGYEQYNAVIFLFTKEYRSRPEHIKKIPSSKQMEKKNGIFFLHNNPYSGPFIDYYYSGKKQGEGMFLNGILTGDRKRYYQNGNLAFHSYFTKGLEDGEEREYYEDGTLKQRGVFVNGKMEGVWESFYQNGQVKVRSKYKTGVIADTATKFYSTGRVKESAIIKNGDAIPSPGFEKINQLMAKSQESNKDGNFKAALRYCSKVIELDSTYADAYFASGTIKLNEFRFEEAIADYDKALKFEPLMEFALSNRAFARIRKYQFAGSRTLSQTKEMTVLSSEHKVLIPQSEKDKICSDLEKAIFLGNKSAMISEALVNYCQTGNIR